MLPDPSPKTPLLDLLPERRADEQRRALERETEHRLFERRRSRVFWQCVALTFAGAPIYLWSWHLTDHRAEIAASFALLVSYAAPFFRWLAYHISESETFGS